jgi:hypothetical protein
MAEKACGGAATATSPSVIDMTTLSKKRTRGRPPKGMQAARPVPKRQKREKAAKGKTRGAQDLSFSFSGRSSDKITAEERPAVIQIPRLECEVLANYLITGQASDQVLRDDHNTYYSKVDMAAVPVAAAALSTWPWQPPQQFVLATGAVVLVYNAGLMPLVIQAIYHRRGAPANKFLARVSLFLPSTEGGGVAEFAAFPDPIGKRSAFVSADKGQTIDITSIIAVAFKQTDSHYSDPQAFIKHVRAAAIAVADANGSGTVPPPPPAQSPPLQEMPEPLTPMKATPSPIVQPPGLGHLQQAQPNRAGSLVLRRFPRSSLTPSGGGGTGAMQPLEIVAVVAQTVAQSSNAVMAPIVAELHSQSSQTVELAKSVLTALNTMSHEMAEERKAMAAERAAAASERQETLQKYVGAIASVQQHYSEENRARVVQDTRIREDTSKGMRDLMESFGKFIPQPKSQ